jgi:hypothetical protein
MRIDRARSVLRSVLARLAFRGRGYQSLKEIEWINPECVSNLKKLDDIKPTFATLKLRNVGLGAIQPLRQCSLCQASSLPGFDQKLAEAFVGRREE